MGPALQLWLHSVNEIHPRPSLQLGRARANTIYRFGPPTFSSQRQRGPPISFRYFSPPSRPGPRGPGPRHLLPCPCRCSDTKIMNHRIIIAPKASVTRRPAAIRSKCPGHGPSGGAATDPNALMTRRPSSPSQTHKSPGWELLLKFFL